MEALKISVPFDVETARSLKAGDSVLLTGTVYTARDAAHQRLCELLREGKELPFPLSGAVLYYLGPTPAPPGRVVGAAGPTSSCRMDAYTPALLEAGLRGIIGKGRRSPEVLEAIRRHEAVYFAATGGAGALIARSIRSSEVLAFPELGTEAVRRLTVCDFPAIVAADASGRNFYEAGRAAYLQTAGIHS